MKTYEFAEKTDESILKERLASKEYNILGSYNIRFGLILVTTTDKDGMVLPTFEPLPYKVKINNAKDRLLKRIDVEIQIDRAYWDECREESEKIAVLDGALYQLEIKTKKDMADYNDDGTVKLKLIKPDMVYAGFSEIAEKYEGSSAEIKKFRQLKREFEGILD